MRNWRSVACVAMFVAASLFFSAHALGQYFVDCSGNTPGAYGTINSVIPLLTDGSTVVITGACTENVTINGLSNLWMGAPWGQTATVQGNLTIDGVRNLFVYGLKVTNSSSDGIDISNSSGVQLDACSSSNNANYGVNVQDSGVHITASGAFNNNGNDGISAGGAGELTLTAWAAPIGISGNLGDGILIMEGIMSTWGPLIITNNKGNSTTSNAALGTPGSGFGVNMWAHSRAVIWAGIAPNLISGNEAGGVALHEGAEISLGGSSPISPGVWQDNIIDRNGPVGVSVGMGSQLTLANGAQITNHSDAGVDVYSHSQVLVLGVDQIANNGAGAISTYPARAGLRVDGNSEAYIRGGEFSQNGGPGILVLTNSSADLSGATFGSNLGGNVVCDSSSWLNSNQDVRPGPRDHAPPCRVPNLFGPQNRAIATPAAPDISGLQAHEAKYRQIISPKH